MQPIKLMARSSRLLRPMYMRRCPMMQWLNPCGVFSIMWYHMYDFTYGRFIRLMNLLYAVDIMGNLNHIWPVIKSTFTSSFTIVVACITTVVGFGTGIYQKILDQYGHIGIICLCIIYVLVVFWCNIPNIPSSTTIDSQV